MRESLPTMLLCGKHKHLLQQPHENLVFLLFIIRWHLGRFLYSYYKVANSLCLYRHEAKIH